MANFQCVTCPFAIGACAGFEAEQKWPQKVEGGFNWGYWFNRIKAQTMHCFITKEEQNYIDIDSWDYNGVYTNYGCTIPQPELFHVPKKTGSP